MNHSIISYTKEQSDLNLGGIQISKCESELKIWEIQLPNFEKGVKFARFLYLFLVNSQIYKRTIKKLYFHGYLLLYWDLAKYSQDDHHFCWILSTDNHHLDYITKLF